MSAKKACNTELRWKLGVVEKQIYLHNRNVQEVEGTILYLKGRCLAAGNGAAEKEKKYHAKLETTHSPQERELLRNTYLKGKVATDQYNLKWATAHREERDQVFPMALHLDALREEEKMIRAQLTAGVNALKPTERALDDIDCEKNKIAMDKWLAEEARSVASLVPGLGRADQVAQLAYLRNGTLDKFHQDRTVRLQADKVQQMSTAPSYKPARHGPSTAAARDIRERQQQLSLRDNAVRQQKERDYHERHRLQVDAHRHHQQLLDAHRAYANMSHPHVPVPPWTDLYHLPGTYGPQW